MDNQLDELERLAKAATPGPWGFRLKPPCAVTLTRKHWAIGVNHGPGVALAFGDTSANAAHIAAASPDAILELIRKYRVAERALYLATFYGPLGMDHYRAQAERELGEK